MTPFLLCLMFTDGGSGPTPIKARADEPPAVVARAIITDVHGQAVPEEMPLGEALTFSARSSVHGDKRESVRWLIMPPERDARKYISPDGMEVFVPTGQKPVTITVILAVASGDTADVLFLKVKCGEGDIPPPVPPDPKPKPDPPKPDPSPQPSALSLAVIDDPLRTTADTRIVLNDLTYWKSLRDRGHDWKFYAPNTSEPEGKRAVGVVSASFLNYPAIVVTAPGQLPVAFQMPKTTAGIDAIIKRYSSR